MHSRRSRVASATPGIASSAISVAVTLERDKYISLVRRTRSARFGRGERTRGGWTVGIGGEYAFTNNVSAFVEYDYYDFGTRRNTLYSVVTPNVIFDLADIRETKSVVKAGINFRWGPAAPWSPSTEPVRLPELVLLSGKLKSPGNRPGLFVG